MDPLLRPTRKTLLAVDIAESVRQIASDERTAVESIRSLLAQSEQAVLPDYEGRLVERRGDGLLVEFADARHAAACALGLHRNCAEYRISRGTGAALRISIHSDEVLTDEATVYGHGVNVLFRINHETAPGETLMSAAARDQLAEGVDGEIEDLGDFYFKGLDERGPTRLFRLRGPTAVAAAPERLPDLRLAKPAVAVIPLVARARSTADNVVGELFADRMIAELSQVRSLRVISRLSTTVFSGREAGLIQHHLRATYVVSGSYYDDGSRLTLTIELASVTADEVLWSALFDGSTEDLLVPHRELMPSIAAEIAARIGEDVLGRALYAPPPTLDDCTLLFWAMTLVNRTHLRDFERPRILLEQLIERHPRLAPARVWLAHWYVMRLVQGLKPVSDEDRGLAVQLINRALNVEPTNAHALATLGFVYCHMFKDFDQSAEKLAVARKTDPNNPWAWVYQGALHAFRGEGPEAERCCDEARACSPVDPAGHFFDRIAATAAFTNQRYDRAIELALRARRGDRYSASAVRVLAMSLLLTGQKERAAEVAEELRRIEPGLTVQGYLARTPAAKYEVGQRCAEALRGLGFPDH